MNGTLSTSNEETPIEFRQKYLPISYQLHMYMMPFFIVVGLIGNPISFAVWISRKVRRNNSSAVYMAMLAINDFFLMLLSIIYYLRTSWGFGIIDIRGICKMFNVVYLYFQYNSVPLVFSFTLERWIAVCYPFKRESCCTENRAWIACGLIFLTVFISVSPQFFLWHYEPNCHFLSDWRNNTYFVIYSVSLEILISALIPIISLGLNIRVIIEMYRISGSDITYQKTVSPNQNTEMCKKPTKKCGNTETSISFKSTTTTLLLVSFFNILTTLPIGAAYLVQNFYVEGNSTLSVEQKKNDPTWIRHFKMHDAKEIIDLLSLSHYCFNIVIYLASSQQFRDRLFAFIKLYIIKRDNNSSSINNSYYKLRQSQETNKTELSFRRKLAETKNPTNIEILQVT